jgi:type I restriction enzyme S subunit
MVSLSRFAKPVERSVSVETDQRYRTIGVKWWGEGAYERETIEGTQTAARTLSLVRRDDLIINKIWVRHGSTAVAGPEVDGCAASSEFPTFDLDREQVMPRWLHWLSKTPWFWTQCDHLSQGTSGKNRIQPERFLTIAVPLPPLPEQRRIVARIEELAGKIAEAKGLREEADQETGFLIRNARESEFRHLFKTIPCSRLGQVTETRLGKMLSAAVKMGISPAPYLRNANIYNDHIDLSSVYEMDFVEGEKEVFALQPGDILINEGGYGVGRCAVWEGQIRPCYFQKSLHRIRVDCSRIQPRFLMHQLIWANEQGLFDDITKATTFQHLTGVRLKQHPLFIPPIAQQSIILHRLDALSKAIDPARTTQRELACDLDALLPSILDKAFWGEL